MVLDKEYLNEVIPKDLHACVKDCSNQSVDILPSDKMIEINAYLALRLY
jgi:hypothetical protein